MANWNPWHGCHKHSEGCLNCYVYRIDAAHGRDSSVVAKTAYFDLPVRKNRDGSYKLKSGEKVWTCFSSDFFVEEADEWRKQAWDFMRERSDLDFLFITKRIDRFFVSLPDDWGDGWDNVTVCCTVENQKRADYRLPIFLEAPIKHRHICCEPLLEHIDLERYLGPWIESVVAGGESGNGARTCDFDWVLSLRAQSDKRGVSFWFKQTGANFRKNGRLYRVPRKYQSQQARRAGLDTHRGR